MSNPKTIADPLDELRSGGSATKQLLEENERLAKALADAESRVKLWTDRADELRKKCDEQYAEMKSLGNTQKMREALKAAKQFLDGYLTNPMELRRKMDAALSAPPRNCDRFKTADEASKEFNYLWNFVWKIGGGIVDGNAYQRRFQEWLFAEAKGENDGSK